MSLNKLKFHEKLFSKSTFFFLILFLIFSGCANFEKFAHVKNGIQENTAAAIAKIVEKGTKVDPAGTKCGYYVLGDSKVILHTNSDGNPVETLMHTAPDGTKFFDIYTTEIKCSPHFGNYSDCEDPNLIKTGDDICFGENGGEQKCELGSDGIVDFVWKKYGKQIILKPTKWYQKIFDEINSKF